MKPNSLLEALNKPTNETIACKFFQVRNRLTEEEQIALNNAVDGIRDEAGAGKAKTYSASWLTKVLRNFGYPISISTIQRHVNKECACERIIK